MTDSEMLILYESTDDIIKSYCVKPETTTYPWIFASSKNDYPRTLPKFKQVIFHDPATIIYWKDGSKTVAKCKKGDVFDKEKGVMVALLKKLYGSKELNNMLSSVTERIS